MAWSLELALTLALTLSSLAGWIVTVRTIRRADRSNRDLLAQIDALSRRLSALEANASPAASPAHRTPPSRRDPAPNVDPAPTLIRIPDLSAPRGEVEETSAELQRRHEPIWSMADAGMPPPEIAREVGLPIGRVELILGLRRHVGRATSAEAEA